MCDSARAKRVNNRHMSALLVLLFLAPTLTGCFGSGALSGGPDESEHWLRPVEERSDLTYRADDIFSRVSINGSYGIDEVRSLYISVPAITLTDGGAGATGDAEVHLGLWLPLIEGCDFDAGEVAEECRVPIIAEIGPYYGDGDVDALTPANRAQGGSPVSGHRHHRRRSKGRFRR